MWAWPLFGDQTEECDEETDQTHHSHPQHVTSYRFTLRGYEPGL